MWDTQVPYPYMRFTCCRITPHSFDLKIITLQLRLTFSNLIFQTLQQHQRVLTGHTGSVLCLQYDEKVTTFIICDL